MNKYKLYWLDGSVNEVEGDTPEDAMNKAGFGAGSVPALDYWEKIKPETEQSNALDPEKTGK